MVTLVTVVETANFAARAKKLLTEAQRQEIAVMVAEDHEYGDPMKGTGGCRKGRFAFEGRGKSGSVRFVHLYCGNNVPTFLVALFAKNEKSNLTRKERNQLAKAVKIIRQTYGA